MSNLKPARVAIAAVVATVAWSDGPAQSAVRICKASIAGDEMKSAKQDEARALALKSWVTLAELNGVNYGAWRVATGRSITCRKLADNLHYCTAKASPCTISQSAPQNVVPKSPPRPLVKPIGDVRT